MKREKYKLVATVLAALINVALNMILIPLIQEKGAAITTVMAEFTVLIYCCLTFNEIKNLIYLKTLVRNLVTGLIECVIIIVLSALIQRNINNWVIYMMFLVASSVFTYVLLLIITKNPISYKLKNIFYKVRNIKIERKGTKI
jgi:O-antigen/teichoic acid export membrane protein